MTHKVRFIALLLWPLLLILGAMPIEAAPTFVTLHWTAPGDDGLIGNATRYDLRYSTHLMTAPSFNAAKAATGLPTPKPPGGQETFTLNGLAPDSTYFIAIKTLDNAGNWSVMSNVKIRSSQILAVEDASALAFNNPWPNPAHGSVNLSLSLPRAAETRVHVYDISSRSVRSLDQAWHGAGVVPLTWDLRDDQGHRVSPGAYIILASALGQQWTRRVVVE